MRCGGGGPCRDGEGEVDVGVRVRCQRAGTIGGVAEHELEGACAITSEHAHAKRRVETVVCMAACVGERVLRTFLETDVHLFFPFMLFLLISRKNLRKSTIRVVDPAGSTNLHAPGPSKAKRDFTLFTN